MFGVFPRMIRKAQGDREEITIITVRNVLITKT